jgi:hypothetical protein
MVLFYYYDQNYLFYMCVVEAASAEASRAPFCFSSTILVTRRVDLKEANQKAR